MRLLLVEDDLQLCIALQKELSASGFAVDVVHNGVDAEHLGTEESYDVVILDIGLPQRSGLEVLKNWRDKGNKLPVIMLTARDSWHERVDGFKAGADDYLGKPFHTEELLMRIQALVRRSHNMTSRVLACPGLQLDEELQQANLADGESVQLTATEFRLLRYFMLNAGKVLSKSRLTEHVYDQDFDRDSNLIEVYIRRLRDKLGKERFVTRRGQGYIFVEQPE